MNAISDLSKETGVRVVFDRVSGDILHIHMIAAVSGGLLPSDEELNTMAISFAVAASNRLEEEVDVLVIKRDELKSGVRYRVDPQTRCLEPVRK